MLLLQPFHIEILLLVNLMFFVVVTYVTMVTNLCIMSSIPQLKCILQRTYIYFSTNRLIVFTIDLLYFTLFPRWTS